MDTESKTLTVNGAVLELTAKENLHLQCLMKGIPNYEVEKELLKLVGLQDTGKKKVKNFSLGMRQRLGIATTLIGNPELLMLDERCKSYISLVAVDANQLTAVLEEKLHTQNFQVMPDKSVKLFDYLDERERVGRVLHENDVIITKMAVCGTSLEDYFMSVIR